ncbi:MAG: hypothetical protein ACYCV4_18860 [Dermatophilaceae bacterium]
MTYQQDMDKINRQILVEEAERGAELGKLAAAQDAPTPTLEAVTADMLRLWGGSRRDAEQFAEAFLTAFEKARQA